MTENSKNNLKGIDRWHFVSDVFMHYMSMKYDLCFSKEEFEHNVKLDRRTDYCMLWLENYKESEDYDQPFPWDKEYVLYDENVWSN